MRQMVLGDGQRVVIFLRLVFLSLLAVPSGVRAEELGHTVNKESPELELRRTVTIRVTNLHEWLQESGYDRSKILLYVDGVPLPGIEAYCLGGDKLLFDLRCTTDANNKAWTTILSRQGEGFFSRLVEVTVGMENERQLPTRAQLKLIRINRNCFYLFLVGCVVVIVLFVWLVRKSDIIRNAGPPPLLPKRKTYSLARTQMAVWFFTIIISYVFIWMVTSDIGSLTPGLIGLMGISAATGLSSAVIDSSKLNDQQNRLLELEEQKKSDELAVLKLTSEINLLSEAIAATPDAPNLAAQQAALAAKQSGLAVKMEEIEQAAKLLGTLHQEAKRPVSESFSKDLLNDDKGVSFHRFQICGWTIVLVCIFLGRVYDMLVMPDFDPTLLAMMGISNGTYLGFKMPEQQG